MSRDWNTALAELKSLRDELDKDGMALVCVDDPGIQLSAMDAAIEAVEAKTLEVVETSRPTIQELEEILDSDDILEIRILPNGEVRAVKKEPDR